MKSINNQIYIFSILTWTLLIGVLLFKGGIDQSGKLLYQSDFNTKITGPFEASNSNSRYALVESIVNHGRFDFSPKLAAFSSPDLSFYNNKYFSIFAPGVSFFAVPFFAFGNLFGAPQLFTYFSTLVIASVNCVLIYLIVKKFTGSATISAFGAVTFFLCTNSIVYALTLTQHQLTIFLLLLACLNIFSIRSIRNNCMLGAIYGFAVLVDLPNILLLLPPIIYAGIKSTKYYTQRKKLIVSLIGFLFTLSLFAGVFALYNKNLTGSVYKIAQNIGRSIYPPDENRTPRPPSQKTDLISTPFKTRSQSQGLQVLLLGNERGWLFYSPILFLSIVGIYLLLKKSPDLSAEATVLLAVLVTNIVIYSMFGDPWGGWAYGARYLLPGAAIASIFVAVSLKYLRQNSIYVLLLIVLGFYSIGINVLGAATSALIPPRQEAIYLGSDTKYTPEKALEILQKNQSGSLLFNAYMKKHLNAIEYVLGVYILALVSFLLLLVVSVRARHHDQN